MALSLKMTEDTERLEKREKCLEFLRKHKVDVGLTSSASGRSRFLLGIHTHGSPVMRIPPRPVVQPALAREGLRAEMAEEMLESCEAAMAGDLKGTEQGLKDAGQAQQKIASKKVGEVAVTYSSGTSSSSVSVNTDLADLTETDFGMQLLGLIKLYGRSVYVP